MSVPPPILDLIAEARGLALPGILAEYQGCEGAKFHSPQPLLLCEYDLTGAEVMSVGDRRAEPGMSAWLCGTCAGNLTVLMALLKRSDGDLSWEARRAFGNLIRALGLKAWMHHLKTMESPDA